MLQVLEKKFEHFVKKQEQTLRVSIYLLLNLSEDVKVGNDDLWEKWGPGSEFHCEKMEK